MLTGPPRSIRQREADLRAVGFSKAEARQILRRPPPKYGYPMNAVDFSVGFTYYERVEVSDTAGGAGNDVDAEADKK